MNANRVTVAAASPKRAVASLSKRILGAMHTAITIAVPYIVALRQNALQNVLSGSFFVSGISGCWSEEVSCSDTGFSCLL